MYTVKLEKFEGPLDLLLQLIEKEELDISQVSLAKVADQYLGYLEKTEDITPGELVDFLMVAARLLYIKSCLILPDMELAEEEDVMELEKQLKIYKEFLEAAKKVNRLVLENRLAFSREKIAVRPQGFYPPKGIKLKHLHQAFENVLKNIEPIVRLPIKTIKKIISLQEKINKIKNLILRKTRLKFSYLIEKSKMDTIVNFLAILELAKQEFIEVEQKGVFDEIFIRHRQ